MSTKIRTKLVAVILAAALLIGAGIFVYFKFFSPGLEVDEVVEPSVTELLYGKLDGIGELNTAEYMCTCLKNYSSAYELKGWKIPLTTKTFTITYDGTVKAGVKDMSKVKIEKRDDIIRVTLPPVEITNSYIDFDSLKVYDQSHNLLNQISVEDVNDAQAELLTEMEQQATDRGIEELALENLKIMLSSMLQCEETEGCTIEYIS